MAGRLNAAVGLLQGLVEGLHQPDNALLDVDGLTAPSGSIGLAHKPVLDDLTHRALWGVSQEECCEGSGIGLAPGRKRLCMRVSLGQFLKERRQCFGGVCSL